MAGLMSKASDYGRSRWQQDYDAYLSQIEQYKGTSFYQQLLNNPYYQYSDYSGGWLKALWGSMTKDYSSIDKFYADRKMAGDEYLAQVLDSMRQQQYDDPAAQVARRKAAGLNDELNGGSQIGSGETPPVAPDDTPPTAPDPSAETGLQIASLGFEVFTGIMNFGSFIQEFSGKSIANAAADFDLTEKGYDSLVKILAGSSSMPGSIDEYQGMSEEDRLALDKGLIDQLDAAIASGTLGDMYSTKRAKKLSKMLRGQIMYDKDGRPTLAYERFRSQLLAERYGSHEKAAESMGSIAFDEDLATFASNIAEKFGQLELNIRQYEEKMAKYQAKYSQEYYGTQVDGETVGTADAKAAVAGDLASIETSETEALRAELDRQIDEMFGELKKDCDNGDKWFHVAGKFLLPIARAAVYRLLNGQLSFGAAAGKSGLALKAIKAAF